MLFRESRGSLPIIELLFCAVALAAIAAFVCLHPEGTSDLFWQLKTGELILRHRALLDADPFSFTALGAPWFNHEWLPEVLFFLVWRARGFAGLSLFSWGVGLALAAIFFAVAARLSSSRPIALALTLLLFLLGAPRLQLLRPDFLSFLFFAFLLFILTAEGERRRWRLFLIPPLIALWANVHASVIGAPVVVLAFLAVQMLSRKRREEGRLPPSPDGTLLLAFLSFLAPMLNPHGWRIYTFPFEHLGQRFSISVTSDWAGLSWFSPQMDVAAWGLVAMSAACALLIVARRRQIPVALAITAAGCTIPAFLMMRFIPYALVAQGLLLARLLRMELDAKRSFILSAAVGITAIILALALPGPVLSVRTAGGKSAVLFGRPMGAGFDAREFPVEAVDFLEKMALGGKFFNDMSWGGYLIWRTWPERRVFIDTRTPVYGDAFVKEYSDALFDAAAFERLARRHDIRFVLYDRRDLQAPGGPLRFLINHPSWLPMFRSGNAVIFVRVGKGG